jgi:hypothetical protein
MLMVVSIIEYHSMAKRPKELLKIVYVRVLKNIFNVAYWLL